MVIHYTNQDVARSYQMMADHLKKTIDSFNRVDTLPRFGSGKEIAARKKAAEILLPIHAQFVAAAQNHGLEAARERNHYEGVEQLGFDL